MDSLILWGLYPVSLMSSLPNWSDSLRRTHFISTGISSSPVSLPFFHTSNCTLHFLFHDWRFLDCSFYFWLASSYYHFTDSLHILPMRCELFDPWLCFLGSFFYCFLTFFSFLSYPGFYYTSFWNLLFVTLPLRIFPSTTPFFPYVLFLLPHIIVNMRSLFASTFLLSSMFSNISSVIHLWFATFPFFGNSCSITPFNKCSKLYQSFSIWFLWCSWSSCKASNPFLPSISNVDLYFPFSSGSNLFSLRWLQSLLTQLPPISSCCNLPIRFSFSRSCAA